MRAEALNIPKKIPHCLLSKHRGKHRPETEYARVAGQRRVEPGRGKRQPRANPIRWSTRRHPFPPPVPVCMCVSPTLWTVAGRQSIGHSGSGDRLQPMGRETLQTNLNLTTPVTQLVCASHLDVAGLWINADLWQHFPRPAPTQEMAVTGKCSLGRGVNAVPASARGCRDTGLIRL